MEEQINKINLTGNLKKFPQICFEDKNVNYYLSSLRANILSVIDLEKSDDLLIVGDDFGVISYFASKKVNSLVLVESDSRYSKQINANNKNISFETSIPNKKYNKIIIFDNLLPKIKDFISDKGTLYFVLNNSLSAASFSGLSNSSIYKKGYSRKEIEKYIDDEGFKTTYFYYPLPDYRFAQTIFSQDYLPKVDDIKNLTSGHLIDRDVLFDEDEFMKNLISSNNFEDFANSFIVEVKCL